MSAILAMPGESAAAPVDVYVDTVQELSDAMANASGDTGIFLTAGFAADLETNGAMQITLPATHDHDITLYSAATLTAMTGGRHFDIVNNGTGTIRFDGVRLANDSKMPSTGGMQLQGGGYEFDGCTFTDLTRAAVAFSGSANDAVFTNCTFKDNLSRAALLAGGIAADKAEYRFEDCLFQDNRATNAGGGAIYIWGSHFDIGIDGCVFSGNRAVGTGTGSGSNNTVDGGAIYVSADYGAGGSLTISDTYFEENFAQDDGGAVCVIGSKTWTSVSSSIVNCTFYGNTVAGAHYGMSAPLIGYLWCTDGSGGAVNYFGMTESEVTHCTFYKNGVTNAIPSGAGGTNLGSVGGGGAIAVDTDAPSATIDSLPPMPRLSNNIFVGNYVANPMSQSMIDFIGLFGGIKERSRTGNVFVLPACDADSQGLLWGMDPRMFENNGNIGYDNGNYDTTGAPKPNSYTDNGISPSEGILVANVFADYVGTAYRGDPNTAIPREYGEPVGAPGGDVYKKCFVVSPTSNELYRDGSVPYVAEVPYDVLGNKRDVFPNAGAVEIFWTMFDPGAGADWTASVPAEVENPDDPGMPYPVVQSLNFGVNNSYYVTTSVGVPDAPSGYLSAMPRSAIEHPDPGYGFMGWRSSVPDLGWAGYAEWAAANGHTEPTVADFLSGHPVGDLPEGAFPLYQPGEAFLSTKQTLTAVWALGLYRVDFDLNYDATPNWHASSEPGREAPRLDIPAGSAILAPTEPLRADYAFGGWHVDAGCSQEWDFLSDVVMEDAVLYAKWDVLMFSVAYHGDGADGGSAPVDAGSPYPIWSQVTVLGKGTLKRTGFTFDGWSVVRGDPSPMFVQGEAFAISGDIDLYPVWSPVPGGGQAALFYIHSSADDGSRIDPLGAVGVRGGGSATFTFHALPGHHIASVLIDGEDRPGLIGAGSYSFSNVARDHSISIISAPDGEAVPPGAADGGTWSPLNLICAVVALFGGVIGVVAGRAATVEREGSQRHRRTAALRLSALAIGVASIIVFMLTEDWTLPAAATDSWTPLMLAMLAATVATMSAGLRRGGAGGE